MKVFILLASLPLAAQSLAVLPPGTSGEVRLVAKPLPMKVYRHMTGLGANDAGLWTLIVRNTTAGPITVTLDDWQLACPGVTFLDATAAGALLSRDTSTSWQSVLYEVLEDAAVGIAVGVQPWVALAMPVLVSVEKQTKGAIPNTGSLFASMKESVTVGAGQSAHTMALAGKVKRAKSCGGFK